MLTIYGMATSGNCYKVQLLLAHLRRPYRWVETNSAAGETRTAEFLARNPNGKVPVLELGPGRYLAESNAILCFLAEGSEMLPADAWERALVLQWLFFEQYSHEPYVAVARFICRWLPPDHERRNDLPRLQARGHEALAVMERQLATTPYLAGERFSIADIALYAYTHAAGDGGIELSGYPHLQRWLDRVAAQPGHVPMAV